MNMYLPAGSTSFTKDALESIQEIDILRGINRENVIGESTGRDVKVAVIDSGIDATHPGLHGPIEGYVNIEKTLNGFNYSDVIHQDSYGHGTACAGIIRSIAPDCKIYSIKVLGEALTGSGQIFIEGLRWAIENKMHICNLSLGTRKKEFFEALHEIADLAYFKNVILITAANNLPIPSYPSVYASVISVASHQEQNAQCFYYNPRPPVEFGALGIDVTVPWLNHKSITATGNSFAAPHITGIVAKILEKHPDLTVFQVKTLLKALASNVTAQ